MCISTRVHTGCQRTHKCVCAWVHASKSYACLGSVSVYKRASACAYICVRVSLCTCVCVHTQLSQVCVINQLSGQFICWVTSCNFPPDSRPLCQVGITQRAHDKTLHLSASFSLFFSHLRDIASFSFSPLSSSPDAS